jgi:Domain of unknown function (DUF4150)
MAEGHIADAESTFKVVNINPDMCFVNGAVVPFDIYRDLPPELSNYSHTVHARGCMVLHVDSVIQGVIGDAGSGVISGVSQGAGNNIIRTGAQSVRVEGQRCARHNDLVGMNGS